MRGTAHGRHTDLGCALSMGTKPRDLFLRHEPSGPVLALVESFPGAMSPLRSKELYDLILSLHPSYKSQSERRGKLK
jgi:hypothetical protein